MTSQQLDFRRAAGFFVTGVTVVTAAHGDLLRAMTANSVSSVSLDPLSMLVCVNKEAVMHGVLSAAGAFCINVLSEDQESLSRACARPDTPEASLEGVPYRVGTLGLPTLAEAIAYFECKLVGALDFGTHTIFVGEVIGFGESEGRTLLFYKGRYGRLPDEVP